MNVNLYLPDELGERAKAAELPLSRLLQQAVSDELDRRDTLTTTLDKEQVYELRVEDRNGRDYIGRVTGKLIAKSGDTEVYLTSDERVIVYNRFTLKHWEVDDAEEELRDALEPAAYADAMAAGKRAVIDL